MVSTTCQFRPNLATFSHMYTFFHVLDIRMLHENLRHSTRTDPSLDNRTTTEITNLGSILEQYDHLGLQ